jgi:hypothetical protein
LQPLEPPTSVMLNTAVSSVPLIGTVCDPVDPASIAAAISAVTASSRNAAHRAMRIPRLCFCPLATRVLLCGAPAAAAAG